MQDIIKTIDEILIELNGGDSKLPWIVTDGYFSLAMVEIDDNKKLKIDDENKSIALKVFVNVNNAEVKLFIAKYVEKNANDKL